MLSLLPEDVVREVCPFLANFRQRRAVFPLVGQLHTHVFRRKEIDRRVLSLGTVMHPFKLKCGLEVPPCQECALVMIHCPRLSPLFGLGFPDEKVFLYHLRVDAQFLLPFICLAAPDVDRNLQILKERLFVGEAEDKQVAKSKYRRKPKPEK